MKCWALPGSGGSTPRPWLIGVLCNLHRQGHFCQTVSHDDRNWAISNARNIAMAINALTEKLRSFAEAASRLPALRGGKSVNPSTVWRWTRRGVRARDGMLVRLESLKVGGTCCTTDEALFRFFHALSADDSQPLAASLAPHQQDEPAPRRDNRIDPIELQPYREQIRARNDAAPAEGAPGTTPKPLVRNTATHADG
jgi:hypothetical protein